MSTSPQIIERLIAYAEGELSPQDAAVIERLLRTDAEAARILALYRAARQTGATDDSVPAPAEVLQRARALFRPQPASTASWLDRAAAAIATLIFDSRLQPAAVRYADASQRLQLAWELEGVEVDIQAQRLAPGAGWRLVGQVSVEQEPGDVRAAALECGSSIPAAETAADERGRFRVELPPGRYDLIIRLPQGRPLLLSGISLE